MNETVQCKMAPLNIQRENVLAGIGIISEVLVLCVKELFERKKPTMVCEELNLTLYIKWEY